MKTITLGNEHSSSYTGTMVITIQPQEQEAFKTMVQRSINTWQDPPPSIRKLHDWLQGRITAQELANQT